MFKSLATKLLTLFLMLIISLSVSLGIYLIGYYKYQPFDDSNTITFETTICNVQIDKRTVAVQHVDTNYFIEFEENNQYVIDDESLYEQIKELETKRIEAAIIISYSYPATNEGYHVLSLKTTDTEYISFEEFTNSYVRGGRGIYLTIASFPTLFTLLGMVWVAYYCPVINTAIIGFSAVRQHIIIDIYKIEGHLVAVYLNFS